MYGFPGQGRLDGAFCDYSETEKMEYMQSIHKQGVVNIEMESLAFAALTHHAGIRSAVICVTLLDRLHGDQVCIVAFSQDRTRTIEWSSLRVPHSSVYCQHSNFYFNLAIEQYNRFGKKSQGHCAKIDPPPSTHSYCFYIG